MAYRCRRRRVRRSGGCHAGLFAPDRYVASNWTVTTDPTVKPGGIEVWMVDNDCDEDESAIDRTTYYADMT